MSIRGTTTATRPVSRRARPEASGDTTYESSSAMARIRTRVASLTPGTSRRARETVAMDTPARRATSAMFTSDEAVLDPRTSTP